MRDGTALSRLRNRRGTRSPPQAPAGARAAADLRSRRAGPKRGRPRRAGGAGTPPALALPARADDRALGRCGARAEPHRLRVAVRPGAEARGRQLSLHAALGGRRRRSRRHPRHPRRRPCHQHRGANPDLRGARAAERPIFGHHNLLTDASGEGLSKRTRRLVDPLAARERRRSAGGRGAGGAGRLGRGGSPRRLARRTRERLRSDQYFARARRASTRRSCARCRRASCITCLSPRCASGWRRSAIAGPLAEPFWLAARGNLARFEEAQRMVERDRKAQSRRSSRTAPSSPQAAACLPPEPWNEETWGAWTSELKALTGRKGRELYHPLRLALDRARSRAGARRAAAADRPRQSVGSIIRTRRLTPSGPTLSTVWPWSSP